MTDVHDTLVTVESSDLFLEFKKSHPKSYLVHAFSTGTMTQMMPIELGYYEQDTIVVFHSDPIAQQPADKVFTDHEHALPQLDIDAVRVGLQDALVLAEKEQRKEYAAHQVVKVICVLQQKESPVWNMTLVTSTLHMLLLKLNAITGEVISRELQNLMSLKKE